jgi:hypothetical protein
MSGSGPSAPHGDLLASPLDSALTSLNVLKPVELKGVHSHMIAYMIREIPAKDFKAG